jgi:hypothetical protein
MKEGKIVEEMQDKEHGVDEGSEGLDQSFGH